MLVSVAMVATVALGCADRGAGAPDRTPTPSVAEIDFDALHEGVATVAAEQAELAPPMARVLEAMRSVDETVEGLRDAEQLDATVSGWRPVPEQLRPDIVEPVRTSARELAAAVDTARGQLAEASRATDDPWEQRYLEAQDLVLQRVREYARRSDALAQVLAHHLPTYREIHEITAAFVERRGFYRSAEEASAAYEVDIGRLLDDLAGAREETARFVEERDEAALALNEASAAAAAIWEQRPSSSPEPTGP